MSSDVPTKALLEVEGKVGGNEIFNSGWVSADAVSVNI